MSRGKGRTTLCTPAEARGRRQQAREFLNVADMVLTERATGAEAHVAAALAVPGAIAAADAIHTKPGVASFPDDVDGISIRGEHDPAIAGPLEGQRVLQPPRLPLHQTQGRGSEGVWL